MLKEESNKPDYKIENWLPFAFHFHQVSPKWLKKIVIFMLDWISQSEKKESKEPGVKIENFSSHFTHFQHNWMELASVFLSFHRSG